MSASWQLGRCDVARLRHVMTPSFIFCALQVAWPSASAWACCCSCLAACYGTTGGRCSRHSCMCWCQCRCSSLAAWTAGHTVAAHWRAGEAPARCAAAAQTSGASSCLLWVHKQMRCACRWVDAGKFLTGFSAVGSIAIPAILYHAEVRAACTYFLHPTRPCSMFDQRKEDDHSAPCR